MTQLRWLLCCTLIVALVLPVRPALARDAFGDDDGTPYERAINVLAAAKIIDGCDDGAVCPHDPVHRGQTASLLSRAFELPAARNDYFTDDDETVHEDAINRLARAGIAQGCDDDAYCIGRTLRRDQMASLLARAADLPPTDDRYFRDSFGSHGAAINRLAAAGITAGCTSDGTRFCPHQQVRRGELAMFVARALDLVPRSRLRERLERRERKRLAQVRERKRRADARRRRQQRQRQAIVRNVWDRLAACEAGGNWSINTGNGYYGGLQFSLGSWRAVGGRGYPHRASRSEQIARGRLLQARQGWGAWPSCSRKLGLR